MKAVQLTTFGDPDVLSWASAPDPRVGPHQLLVKVKATALNRADLLQRRGKYPAPAGDSPILGLEIAGDVVAWGSEVAGFSVGQRVFGLVGGGGYAEYCVIDKEMAILIPSTWDYVQAAAVPEAFFTADETVFTLGELKEGETILIHAGASGVGSAAIQMAVYSGATVFTTAGSAEKIVRLNEFGIKAAFNYHTQDFAAEIKQQTDQQGVDVIEDFIGASYFPQHLLLLKERGRLIQVGTMGGTRCEIDLSVVLRKRLQIKGSVMRTRSLADKREICQRFCQRWLPVLVQGHIKPVIDRVYPIADVVAAHQRMESNQNFGKIVLAVGD